MSNLNNNINSINNQLIDNLELKNDDKYKLKCFTITKLIKEMIFYNGALDMDLKDNYKEITKLKIQREYLIKKLINYERIDLKEILNNELNNDLNDNKLTTIKKQNKKRIKSNDNKKIKLIKKENELNEIKTSDIKIELHDILKKENELNNIKVTNLNEINTKLTNDKSTNRIIDQLTTNSITTSISLDTKLTNNLSNNLSNGQLNDLKIVSTNNSLSNNSLSNNLSSNNLSSNNLLSNNSSSNNSLSNNLSSNNSLSTNQQFNKSATINPNILTGNNKIILSKNLISNSKIISSTKSNHILPINTISNSLTTSNLINVNNLIPSNVITINNHSLNNTSITSSNQFLNKDNIRIIINNQQQQSNQFIKPVVNLNDKIIANKLIKNLNNSNNSINNLANDLELDENSKHNKSLLNNSFYLNQKEDVHQYNLNELNDLDKNGKTLSFGLIV